MPNGRPAPVPLEALPLPGAPPEIAQPQPAQPRRQIPAGAGYAGTTGKVANIASSFIEKFIEGKERGEAQRRQGISDELGFLKGNVQMAHDNLAQDPEYLKLLDDPEANAEAIAKKETNLNLAWQAYTGTIGEYVKTNKPKGSGLAKTPIIGPLLSMFAPSGKPELFPEMMAQQMAQAGPPRPAPRSPREKADILAYEAAERRDEDLQRLRDLTVNENKTPSEFEEQVNLENLYSGVVGKDAAINAATRKMQQGIDLSDQETQMLRAAGVLPPAARWQIGLTQGVDDQGNAKQFQTWFLPPDAGNPQGQTIQTKWEGPPRAGDDDRLRKRYDSLKSIFKDANPDATDSQAAQFALAGLTQKGQRGPRIPNITPTQAQTLLTRAIKKVYERASAKDRTSFKPFLAPGKSGAPMPVLLTDLAPEGAGHSVYEIWDRWIAGKRFDMNEDELGAAEKDLLTRVADEFGRMGLTQEQIDAMWPGRPVVPGNAGFRPMAQRPGAGYNPDAAPGGPLEAPPGGAPPAPDVRQLYKVDVLDENGNVIDSATIPLTEANVAAEREKGRRVTLAPAQTAQ